ncbi:MAG: sigma-70 family RNA polymerase sigma factor [Planctomycetia bacterium]|nr:sigma-70 family RNA polymerase sigma factor [Planctomycetia bacterium]
MSTPAPFSGRNHVEFVATRWSVVLAAGGRNADSRRQRALEDLARIYWFPLYAYVRRQGQSPQTAEDLTQAFFARLIEKHSLRRVDRSKGKFRSFLLASLKHFLSNEYDKTRTEKRGGRIKVLALDAASAEARYSIEPVDHMTPERVFEQRWAWAVLDQVLLRLRAQYDARGQGGVFEALKGALLERPADGQYAESACELGMTQGAVVVAAHRLRGRYRKLLRDEIAQTVADPQQIDEEVQYLLGCL